MAMDGVAEDSDRTGDQARRQLQDDQARVGDDRDAAARDLAMMSAQSLL
jgi:hypothetical protein